MKRFTVNHIGVLLVFTLLITACSGRPEASANNAEGEEAQIIPTPTEEPSVPIEVGLVETGDIDLIFSYSGTIQPQDEIAVIPGASGRVETVLIEEGDHVRAGDPIAIINDDTIRTQIKQAQAVLASAKLNLAKLEIGSRPEEIIAARAAVELARAALNDVAVIDTDERTEAASDLARAQAALREAQAAYDKIAWAGNVGETPQALALERATIGYETELAKYNLDTNPSASKLSPLMLQLAQAELNLSLKLEPFRPIDFELAKVGVQQAEAALEQAELQLKETVIEAPFDGVIADLTITEGSRVNLQTPIASLISEALEAVVDVQENLISQVEENQSASMNVTAFPNQDFPGVVTSVAPQADTNTRTFQVKVTPTEGADLLRSGMYANVSILARENTNTVLAPRSAVILGGDAPIAFVVTEEDTVEERTVTTGIFDQERIEILSGLKPGELVVTAGQTNLVDGIKVDVSNDPRIAE